MFWELLNQYQTCLYSFEWFSHDDSKVKKFQNLDIFEHFMKMLHLSSAHACHMRSVKTHVASSFEYVPGPVTYVTQSNQMSHMSKILNFEILTPFLAS